jgi:hypothetical protein
LDKQCPFSRQVSGAGGLFKSPNLEGYTTAMSVSQREGLGAAGIMANDRSNSIPAMSHLLMMFQMVPAQPVLAEIVTGNAHHGVDVVEIGGESGVGLDD